MERATASAENAGGSRSAWIRVSGLPGQARTAATTADEQDRHGCQVGRLVCLSREKSIQRFKERVRQLTRRGVPLKTKDLIEQLNPVLRGWGHYYKRAHVRTLFNKLDRWIERRIWSHRYHCWRNCGWKQLPKRKLYGEYGLVQLVKLIPSIASQNRELS